VPAGLPASSALSALAALLLTPALVVAASLEPAPALAVVLGVQVLAVLTWFLVVDPPGRRGVAVVALGAAVVGDGAVLRAEEASLAPLAGVVALAFVAVIVTQLLRGAGRSRVTEAFGSTMALVVVITGLSVPLVLGRVDDGAGVLAVCVLAGGAAVVAAHLVDLVVARPALAPGVTRGVPGIVLGAAAGTGVAVTTALVTGSPDPLPAAGVGWAVALAAVLADVGTAYAAAGRVQAGEDLRPSPLRAVLGPLVALAVAAPAAYVLGLLVLA